MLGRMRVLLLPLASLALLAGCASAGFEASGGERLPPHEGPVAVLERLPPPGSYRLLGVVTVHGVGLTSDARKLEHLEARAALAGADAVVPQGAIRDRPTADGGEERTLAGYAIRRQR